jgi:hypothetical protein
MRPPLTANDGDPVRADSPEDQMQADHETAETGSKAGTIASDERKSSQVLEIRIDPANKSDGSMRIAMLELPL